MASWFARAEKKKKQGLRILCVDDEERVLAFLERDLGKEFTVFTAASGADGLETLRRHRDIAIVVSDMKMPEMDGAEFLSRVRESWPNTVRILLTGQADIEAAADAVNRGAIFRFLLKPCDREELRRALDDARAQLKDTNLERNF